MISAGFQSASDGVELVLDLTAEDLNRLVYEGSIRFELADAGVKPSIPIVITVRDFSEATT